MSPVVNIPIVSDCPKFIFLLFARLRLIVKSEVELFSPIV